MRNLHHSYKLLHTVLYILALFCILATIIRWPLLNCYGEGEHFQFDQLDLEPCVLKKIENYGKTKFTGWHLCRCRTRQNVVESKHDPVRTHPEHQRTEQHGKMEWSTFPLNAHCLLHTLGITTFWSPVSLSFRLLHNIPYEQHPCAI